MPVINARLAILRDATALHRSAACGSSDPFRRQRFACGGARPCEPLCHTSHTMPPRRMMQRAILSGAMLTAFASLAVARGVTPYLPLNLEPEMESQIERVLILGDKPVLTRPIAAARVLDALPKACKVDEALCM